MLDIFKRIRFKSKIAVLHKSFGLCFCIILFLVGTLYAKTEVFFSPNGLIRDKIIKAIRASEESIDIAVLILSAGEIAEALHEAKGRGVKVRIILDHRQIKKYDPVIEFLKEEDFTLQFLKGKIGGTMNNRFAIFDSKLVVTGSYYWSEYGEKFNYENALFVDDIDVIKKFQEEFDSLYGKCHIESEKGLGTVVPSEVLSDVVTESVREVPVPIRLPDSTKSEDAVPIQGEIEYEYSAQTPFQVGGTYGDVLTDEQGKRVGVLDGETIANGEKSPQFEVQSGEREHTLAEELVPPDVLAITFHEFDSLFGRKGTLGRSERKRVWKDQYEGKYVKWTGEIGYKGIAVYDWNRIGIRHKDKSIDVQLRVDWTKKQKLRNLVMGDVITYRGKLVSLGGFMAPYKLDDVDVLEVQVTQ